MHKTKSFALGPIVTEPEGRKYVGIDLLVKEGKGRLAWITNFMEENNISIATIFTDSEMREERAVFLACDMTNSKITNEELLEKLRSQEWVMKAELSPRFKKLIYSQQLFPPVFGFERGIGLGIAHMTALFVNLYRELGTDGASTVLCGLGRFIGETVYNKYTTRFGLTKREEFIKLLHSLAIPSGYGYIEDYSIDRNTIVLYMRDDWESITKIASKMEVRHDFMKCFLEGYFEKVFNRDVKVTPIIVSRKKAYVVAFRISVL
jgi:predicted hydrocarbon binding protein